MGTGLATSFVPGLGAGKLAGAGSMIGRAAFEGLGTADDKLSMEGATQTGIGAAFGMGGALVSGALKKFTSADPNKIRANVLGARTSEFKEIGLKERETIAKELKDMGLFQSSKVDFDPAAGKFISKGKTLENLEKPVREKLMERLDSATSKIQEEKLKVLGKHSNDPIDSAGLESNLNKIVEKYSKEATGRGARRAEALAVKEDIMKDIWLELEENGAEDITVKFLEDAKMRVSRDVGNYGKNPLLQKTPDTAQIYQSMYASINKTLREALGDSKYAHFNDMQQKMLTAKTDLAKIIASEDAQKTQAGWGGWFNKVANETLGSPESGLGMAAAKENLDAIIPKKLQSAGRLLIEETPFQGIRYIDPSVPTVQPPYRKEDPRSTMISPREMINFRIPRSTQGILQNKELVIGKLAQNNVPDELISTITQALNDDHEAVSNIAPMIIQQFPGIFERSKYEAFDGIIASTDRARAADAISKKDDMNSIQKAKAINGINKSGILPKELV